MNSPPCRYDVHGLALSVACRARPLRDEIDRLLGFFAGAGRGDGFSLHAGLAEPKDWPAEPAAFGQRWRGRLADGLELAWLVAPGRRRYMVPNLACLDADLDSRQAALYVAPGGERCFRHTCLMLLLTELLARDGQHVIHAAALAAGPAGRRRALLLAGASGRGKTTTALALARSGMDLLADDAAFVRRGCGGELLVWGLRQPIKVHRQTIELLPWLADAPMKPAAVPGEQLADLRDMLPCSAEEVRPAALVFLEPRNDASHCLRPLDAVAALERLVRENVRPAEPSCDAAAGAAFRLLAELAGRCRSFTLSVGPRLDTLREAIISVIAE